MKRKKKYKVSLKDRRACRKLSKKLTKRYNNVLIPKAKEEGRDYITAYEFQKAFFEELGIEPPEGHFWHPAYTQCGYLIK